MISWGKRFVHFYLSRGWMPLLMLITACVFIGVVSSVLDIEKWISPLMIKWVVLSVIAVLTLGFIPSTLHCFRQKKWIWGIINAIFFILYTSLLILGNAGKA